jgi:translation initiation factor IF-2
MGHVDHGKTSLLDAIRKANVAAGEAGGITQHIGAYSVTTPDGKAVTFLDTPGHEAFTAMRARGAKVTDVVVIVVAADDGVMPQTREAINHAKAAEVPILVAINKMDKPGANPQQVKNQLMEFGLVDESLGGDTIMVPVSAKTKEGLPSLIEMLLLQAEVLDLKADPSRPARGAVVEAKVEKGRGPVATVIVEDGTLRVGDALVTGTQYGRVRAMLNDRGEKVEEVLPGHPVEVLGLSGVPTAGDDFNAVENEAAAKEIAGHRSLKEREKELTKTSKVKLEDFFAKAKTGEVKELKLVIKADVQGSVEAVSEALRKLSGAKVTVNVIHAGVGGPNETDVMLASASNGIIIGFNVRPEPKAAETASKQGVDIRNYSIIYEAVDEVRKAMEGLLEPIRREHTLGRAEVRNLFSVPKLGTIAGCAVVDGKIARSAMVRLIRDSKQVYTGKIGSLRRFKDDVREVASGFECGLSIDGYADIKQGDVIEAYEIEEIRQSLD